MSRQAALRRELSDDQLAAGLETTHRLGQLTLAPQTAQETAAPATADTDQAKVKTPDKPTGLNPEQKLELEQFEAFMKDSERYPLLTAAEEVELIKEIRRGPRAKLPTTTRQDAIPIAQIKPQLPTPEDARTRFVKANLRLIGMFARRAYEKNPRARKLGLMDLYQEGYFGLEHAINMFDPDKGFKFSTYGSRWIQFYIERAVDNKADTIRVSIKDLDILMRLRRLDFTERSGKPKLSDEEIQAQLEIDELELAHLREILNRHDKSESLETPTESSDGESIGTVSDIIADPDPALSVPIPALRTDIEDGLLLSDEALEALNLLDAVLTDSERKVFDNVLHGSALDGDVPHRALDSIETIMSHPALHAQLKGLLGDETSVATDWRDEAACKEGYVSIYLHPGRSKRQERETMSQVCGSCAVRAQCLEYFTTDRPTRGRWPVVGRWIEELPSDNELA